MKDKIYINFQVRIQIYRHIKLHVENRVWNQVWKKVLDMRQVSDHFNRELFIRNMASIKKED
jgi:hypothetical protein